MMVAMFDTAPAPLALAFYFLVFICIARCLTLLRKRPFPVNAPMFVAGHPLVGAVRFLSEQGQFCYENMTASPTGNYSFYLGRDRVVGLSGPQGRKTFFESRDLDLNQGVNLFFPSSGAVERASDKSAETHDEHVKTAMRTAFQRTEGLASVPTDIHACTTSTWKHIAAQDLFDPFRELSWLYAQASLASLGMGEVAQSPKVLRKVISLVSVLEGTFSAADMVVPWLLNPFHIPVVIAIGRLYVILWQIIRHRKQEQQQKPEYRKQKGLMQPLIAKGKSTRAIIKTVVATQVVSQVISPTLTSWLLMGLATDAYWMAGVRREVDQVIDKYRKKGQSAEQVLQTLDVHAWEHEFPLLNACLLETIRTRGVLLSVRKNISQTDIPIGDTGEVIPAGAFVIYHADEVHMNPDIYPDPQRWDPGRFLPDRAEYQKELMAFIGFGLGRRPCPGQRLARIQNSMVVARFVAMFDIALCDEQGDIVRQLPAPSHTSCHCAPRPESSVRLRCTDRS